jgi:predicted nucleic acid-binding protein
VNYLIDTNIISELRKGAKCDRNVAFWFESIVDADIYLSVLVLGEIRRGVERARPKAPAQGIWKADRPEMIFSAMRVRRSARCASSTMSNPEGWP